MRARPLTPGSPGAPDGSGTASKQPVITPRKPTKPAGQGETKTRVGQNDSFTKTHLFKELRDFTCHTGVSSRPFMFGWLPAPALEGGLIYFSGRYCWLSAEPANPGAQGSSSSKLHRANASHTLQRLLKDACVLIRVIQFRRKNNKIPEKISGTMSLGGKKGWNPGEGWIQYLGKGKAHR